MIDRETTPQQFLTETIPAAVKKKTTCRPVNSRMLKSNYFYNENFYKAARQTDKAVDVQKYTSAHVKPNIISAWQKIIFMSLRECFGVMEIALTGALFLKTNAAVSAKVKNNRRDLCRGIFLRACYFYGRLL